MPTDVTVDKPVPARKLIDLRRDPLFSWDERQVRDWVQGASTQQEALDRMEEIAVRVWMIGQVVQRLTE